MSELFLHRAYYPVTTLGYGKRLGVWVRGCGKACPGCISPELKEPLGSPVDVEEVIRRIPEGFEADGLTISGGEPFDQPRGVLQLIRWFSREISEDILIFTGYTIEELRGFKDPDIDEILGLTAVLVEGPYIEELNSGRGLRGSDNQRVIVQRFPERYRDAEHMERQVQFIGEGDHLVQIGIPPLEP